MCRFNFLADTVELNYQPTLLETLEEIALVILGPIMNIPDFNIFKMKRMKKKKKTNVQIQLPGAQLKKKIPGAHCRAELPADTSRDA